MTTLVLVRHGQASLGSDDYDRLSELGREQSERLGRYWGERGTDFSEVRIGPLRRHRETHAAIAEGYQSCKRKLPAERVFEAMREHQAIAVMQRMFGDQQAQLGATGGADAMKAWFEEFDAAMRRWILGDVEFDDLESWQEARARVGAALEQFRREAGGGRVLGVTSGGFVCMAVGAIRGLSDIEVYEMSLRLRNSAWAEIRFSGAGAELAGFNLHPHLSEPELCTVV